MLMISIIFILIYTWIVYPGTMFVLAKLRKNQPFTVSAKGSIHQSPSSLTIIIPAHNCETTIAKKILNCLSLRHSESSKIIVISDGSSDRTCDIVRQSTSNQVELIELKERSGKSHAQNVAIEQAVSDFILLTDVDSDLREDALEILFDAYMKYPRTGCVGGKISFNRPNLLQRLYWRFENGLRSAESIAGSLVSISGAAILMKREHFKLLDKDTGDDMVIPLDLKLDQGLRSIYTDTAIVNDQLASKSMDIFNSRRRITSRNCLAISRRKRLLNPLRFPLTSITLLSHKLLRWLTPIFGIILAVLVLTKIEWQPLPVAGIAVIVLFAYLFIPQVKVFLAETFGLIAGIADFIRGRTPTYY